MPDQQSGDHKNAGLIAVLNVCPGIFCKKMRWDKVPFNHVIITFKDSHTLNTLKMKFSYGVAVKKTTDFLLLLVFHT